MCVLSIMLGHGRFFILWFSYTFYILLSSTEALTNETILCTIVTDEENPERGESTIVIWTFNSGMQMVNLRWQRMRFMAFPHPWHLRHPPISSACSLLHAREWSGASLPGSTRKAWMHCKSNCWPLQNAGQRGIHAIIFLMAPSAPSTGCCYWTRSIFVSGQRKINRVGASNTGVKRSMGTGPRPPRSHGL